MIVVKKSEKMDYYCKVSDIFIEPKSKYNHFKSNTHKEFDKNRHKKLTIEKPDINDIDKTFYAYIIRHKKNYHYYLNKCEFKLVFNDYQYCPDVTSFLSNNKTMCSRQNFLEKAINDFENKGFTSNHKAERNILTIAIELDMSYDFCIRHNMHAVEWNLNAMINKHKSLINKLNCNWRHLLIRKFIHMPIKYIIF